MKFRHLLGLFGSALASSASLSACDGEIAGLYCPDGQRKLNGICWAETPVRVNSVSYHPARKKAATTTGTAATFEVRSAKTDEVVFEGTAGPTTEWMTTGETLAVLDFSELRKAGRYYIQAGDERSSEFGIGLEGFEDALNVAMLGMYGQRCGEAVSIRHGGNEFEHGECHLAPASLSEVGGGSRDDTGGWHDAGDYGKYTNNGAFAAAFLLKAFAHHPEYLAARQFEIPEQGDETPDMLDEARVEVEWLLKIQLDDGSFPHKVTGLNFEASVLPENDQQQRFFAPVGTVSSAAAVAVLALSARLFEPFDAEFAERCLTAAEAGQTFLDANPDEIRPDLNRFSTGAYLSGDGDRDERAWALTELFETTGKQAYLEAFESMTENVYVSVYFDWAGVRNLAFEAYLRSGRPGRDPVLVDKIARAFLVGADEVVRVSTRDPYARGTEIYSWGANGAVARIAFVLSAAHFVDPNPEYLDALQGQLDHLFGRNAYGRSYLTGIGTMPPQFPHHRPSQADDVAPPWPGLLIGGPHSHRFNGPENLRPGDPGYTLPALTWTDEYQNYLHNEVAINWNTALTYALVTLIDSSDEGSGCDCISLGGAGGEMGLGGADGER